MTIFTLWLTICAGHSLTLRCQTERHICAEPVCIEIIRERKHDAATVASIPSSPTGSRRRRRCS